MDGSNSSRRRCGNCGKVARVHCNGEAFRTRSTGAAGGWGISLVVFHRLVALRDEPGNIVKWYGTSIDIEDRKWAEEGLRQDEKRLRQLIDAIPQHVIVLEPDGNSLYVNQVGLDYTGLTPEESVAKDALAKIYHPEDLERVLRERREAISQGTPGEVEARILGADGRYRWFLIRIHPLRDEQGRVLRWYGTRTDIEDRKQAEEALRRNRAYLTEAQSLSHTGSFGWKPSTGEHLWSEETYRIFQYDPTTKPTVELILDEFIRRTGPTRNRPSSAPHAS